jgi:hypothetical protein
MTGRHPPHPVREAVRSGVWLQVTRLASVKAPTERLSSGTIGADRLPSSRGTIRGGRLRYMDRPVLDQSGLGVQAHGLLAVRLVARFPRHHRRGLADG